MVPASTLNRHMLAGQLRPQGCDNPHLTHAFEVIPREKFVAPEAQAFAYVDAPASMSEQRFMLSPLMQSHLIMAAHIQPHERVLDVACGTGYSTALISFLAKEVVGLEPQKTLTQQATKNLQTLEIYNASMVNAPLCAPEKAQGPYDVIIIEGALPFVAEQFFNLLTPQGRLVQFLETATPWSRLVVCQGSHMQVITEGQAPSLSSLWTKD